MCDIIELYSIDPDRAMTMALAGCMMQQRNALVPVACLVIGIIIFGAALNF